MVRSVGLGCVGGWVGGWVGGCGCVWEGESVYVGWCEVLLALGRRNNNLIKTSQVVWRCREGLAQRWLWAESLYFIPVSQAPGMVHTR